MPRFSDLTRSTLLRVAGAVAALAVAVPVTGASAADPPIAELPCGTRADSSGKYQRLSVAGFPQPAGVNAGQEITGYAVAPKARQASRNTVVVTNGKSVLFSEDGGCSFVPGLSLEQVPTDTAIPLSGLLTTIVDLYIASNGTVYALAEELETGETVGRPHVLISTQNGRRGTWTLGDQGLPPVGKPVRMRASRQNPRVMYLSFTSARREGQGGVDCPPQPLPCPDAGQEPPGPPGLLWGSVDGGRTWTARTDPADLNGAATIRYYDIEDDDASGNTLWAVANGRLRLSLDGGRTFTVPEGVDQSGLVFTAVKSYDNGERRHPLKVVAFSQTGEMIRLQGTKWIRSKVPFPGPVTSIANRAEGDLVVVSRNTNGTSSTWRIYPHNFIDFEDKDTVGTLKHTSGWEGVNPVPLPSVDARVNSADTASGADTGTFYLRDTRALYRFLGSKFPQPEPPVDSDPVGPPTPPRGIIAPSALELDLGLGKTQVVDYTLTLPRSPTPLDVYLLVDNSGSMQPLIADLKATLSDVAHALVGTGVDVNVGVGQINTQPPPDQLPIDDDRTEYDEGKPRPLYERLRAVGPVDAQLFAQLGKLNGLGGSGDEAQIEALYQSITGEGQDTAGLGPLIGYQIKKDQEAQFRFDAEAIHVVVHATDEPFSTNIRNGNTFAEAALALRNAKVKQIGLSQGAPLAHKDLSDMARATEAVAPAGGVDCSGDGRPDIAAGKPLVCSQNTGLDKTLVNLLNSLADPQKITLIAPRTETMRNVSRRTFAIDAKKRTEVTFRITFSCANVPPGVYVNNLEASLRGLSVAKATATVACGGATLPPRQAPGVPGGLPGEPPGNPPLPQPNPPIPVPAPVQPVAQPQVQTQVQTQVNPQAGAAEQEQEQVNVATATQELEGARQDDDQLAMSGLGYERTAPAPYYVTLAGMGLASACATAVALRRRTRTQVAKVRIR